MTSEQKRQELNELYESQEAAEIGLSEIECQHHSEVALCGDAWPGAAIELEEIRKRVRQGQERIAELRGDLGIVWPPPEDRS